MRSNFTVLTAFIICLLMAIIPVAGQSQDINIINGKVLDAQDQTPIMGASVSISTTQKGTVTDAQGNFTLSVNANAVLIITYVGYAPEKFPLRGRKNITIALQKEVKSLNEVVVTALGISKQSKALGYAVQSVNTRQITQAEDPNLINNLSGKIAGVYITNGGAGVGSTSRIVIRGENSFSGTNQPLFVVDGVPINNETYFNNAIENSANQGTWAEVDYGNGAAEINPNDIAKVTVLKGSTAAALYGSRAANGAIVLTTKKGTPEKGMQGISFNSTTTFETPLKLPRLQNQYGAGINAYPLSGNPSTYTYQNGGASNENNIPNWGLKFDPTLNVVQFDSPIPGTPYQAADLVARSINPGLTPQGTPWVGHADHFKNFLQTGITTQNNIGFGGVSDKGSYHFSISNLYNRGILPNTDLRRNGISLRTEHKYSDKLTSDVFIDFINSNSSNRPNIGYGSESVMYTYFGVYGMPYKIEQTDTGILQCTIDT